MYKTNAENLGEFSIGKEIKPTSKKALVSALQERNNTLLKKSLLNNDQLHFVKKITLLGFIEARGIRSSEKMINIMDKTENKYLFF